jgi:hypothetical protein
MRRRHERGTGKIGCLLGLLVLVGAVVVVMKAAPTKIAVAELKDFAVHEAESASLPHHDNQQIVDALVMKAHALDLPVGAEGIKVWRDGAYVHIEMHYTVPIDFPFYTYVWDVHDKIERVQF